MEHLYQTTFSSWAQCDKGHNQSHIDYSCLINAMLQASFVLAQQWKAADMWMQCFMACMDDRNFISKHRRAHRDAFIISYNGNDQRANMLDVKKKHTCKHEKNVIIIYLFKVSFLYIVKNIVRQSIK